MFSFKRPYLTEKNMTHSLLKKALIRHDYRLTGQTTDKAELRVTICWHNGGITSSSRKRNWPVIAKCKWNNLYGNSVDQRAPWTHEPRDALVWSCRERPGHKQRKHEPLYFLKKKVNYRSYANSFWKSPVHKLKQVCSREYARHYSYQNEIVVWYW